MPEEYIMSSKACAYILGGSANNASLFDFDGVYILDGGFAEKATGFVAHVRNVSGVLLSAPTKNNLGTVAALLEQNQSVPVYTNTKPLKAAKPGSSGEQVKQIQEANAKLLAVETPLFSPKYQPYIIYQSAAKGILSLYVLAGDVKDGEAITKALASGNEAEVERAAAEHGTIGVLLWRSAERDAPAIRVLISGTSSLARIQQSLDKAAKHLPFLNAAVVKSKDALSDIPAPSVARPAAAKTLARPTPPSSSTRPAAPATRAPLRAATTAAPPSRPATAKPALGSRAAPAPAVKVPPPARTRPAAPTTSRPAAPAKKPIATSSRAPAPSSIRSSAETVAQKKTVGKVQGAAPSKPAAKPAPISKPAAPEKKPSPPPSVVAAVPPTPVIVAPDLDDSVICLTDLNQQSSSDPLDIVVIPPTPEPPRADEPKAEVDNVEPEIPPPVDAFKKPEPTPSAPEVEKPDEPHVTPAAPPAPEDEKSHEPEPGSPGVSTADGDDKPAPVYPSLDDITPAPPSLIDVDPVPAHPEPSAPAVPADHVIISSEDPALPDITAAVPFVPHVPGAKDELITLDDDKEHVAPGFEEPLIPQAPREDGTLADCSEEISKLVEISMDTDNSTAEADTTKPIGEVTQLASDLQSLQLNDETNEYVRKISNQMIQDATLPFTSALASSIVGGGDVTSAPNGVNGHEENSLVDFGINGHNGSDKQTEEPKETSKHDLMQSRSSVLENGAPVEYEKTDPAIDDILAACANESDKLDAAHSEVLHMPERPGVAVAKSIKFARHYYFDVATVPHKENQELTVNADSLCEFVSKIRSRNLILPSKDISGEQLSAVVAGKQMWCESAHPCAVVPTHSSPTLVDFRTKNEALFPASFLSFVVPVDKQRTTVSSPAAGAVEYELATLPLRE